MRNSLPMFRDKQLVSCCHFKILYGQIKRTVLQYTIDAFDKRKIFKASYDIVYCFHTMYFNRYFYHMYFINPFNFPLQYLWLYNQKAGHLSPRFEKLIKLTGVNLTQYVYAMITYIQVCNNFICH